MILYLLRHGPAGPGHPDEARTLTPEGAWQIAQQAAFFQAAGIRPDRLLTSPLVRARQTAELVGAALGLPPVEVPVLRCGFRFEEAVDLLRTQPAGVQSVLLVGHQPDLGRLVHLFSGNEVVVQPGTLVELSVAQIRRGGGTLVGLIDPAVAAKVGRALGAEDGAGGASRVPHAPVA